MNKPVRVLHIIQRMESAGSQTFLMNLYRNIDRSRVQFDFLVHYKEKQFFDNEIENLGGKIYRLSVREDYNLFKYYRDLNRFFDEHKEYKIVHGHMHSLGAIYLYCAKKNGIPIRIAHSHNNGISNNFKKPLKIVMTNCYKINANYLFACSETAGKFVFGNDEFKVINNAIDADKFIFNNKTREKIRAELGLEGKIVIGHVGRFELQKNHHFLVEIFREIKRKRNDAILLLIGEGTLKEKIKQKVIDLGLQDSVMFMGTRHDINRIYQAMDVFILPSLFEGLGIVAVEAQAAGIPTICTDTLPKETNLTPLFFPMSLKKSSNDWAEEALRVVRDNKAYSDTSSYIKNGGYDIKDLSKEMEKIYLSKYL